jgi:hypothetical protein
MIDQKGLILPVGECDFALNHLYSQISDVQSPPG